MAESLSVRLRTLVEATYARDAGVRAQAAQFYADLRAYLDAPPEALARRLGPPTPEGMFKLTARAFTDVGPADLLVILAPRVGRESGGIGTLKGAGAGSRLVILLRTLRGPGDLTHAATRLGQRTVEHEVAHLLDPGLRAQGGGSAARVSAGDLAGYYNAPGEWNAYWQEGAAQAERMLRGEAGQNPKINAFLFGDGTRAALAQRVDKHWDKDFLAALTADTQRRFDKRLAALWQQWRAEGLL